MEQDDYGLVMVCYISKGGVNIAEGKGLVWLCRFGDDNGYDMVAKGKAGSV